MRCRRYECGAQPGDVAPPQWPFIAGVLGACSASTRGRGVPQDAATTPPAWGSTSPTPSARPTSPTPSSSAPISAPLGEPVHVSLLQGDGQTYGIGFAIIAQFNVAHRPVQRRATDSVAFTHAVAVNVNGQPAGGAWFGQKSEIPGYAVDALYRRQHSWSARCAHHRGSAVEGAVGRSLGCPTTSLTSSMRTGPANVSTVDSTTHQMAVTSDGKVARTMPVSLGSGGHPTFTGTKVVMEKDKPARMVSSPGEAYYNVLVPWSVRITDSGEFIHAASWNTANIGSRNTPTAARTFMSATPSGSTSSPSSAMWCSTRTRPARRSRGGTGGVGGTCLGRSGRPAARC
jgi:hypothetical protein